MRVPRSSLAAMVFGGLLIGTTTAFGQAALPQPKTQGDVTWLNGGAGDEEVQSIRQAMKDYTLALVFSHAGSPQSEYVASVSITVKDGQGATVFEAPSVGPWLLLRLPPGRYSVIATYQHVTQTRPVTSAKSATSTTTFVWT